MQQKKLIEGQDYVTRVLPFPNNASDGALLACEDGLACIYINQNVCPQRQKKALKHELNHILNDDLYDDITPIKEIEERADGTGSKIIPKH